jgi:hypothetical protein
MAYGSEAFTGQQARAKLLLEVACLTTGCHICTQVRSAISSLS